jgi:aspartyl-tRNA(Asn)/glutamyl-tRNA(Gln) amidotransferase subunit A
MTRRELLASFLLAGPAAAPVLAAGARPSAAAADLTSLDLRDILHGVAARSFSPIELANAYLERIARVDPALGAYVTVTAERARADARRLETARGALRAVPIAHKDLVETAGILTTGGSRLFERHIPARDADIARHLVRAGTILLGKTNTHELGGGVTTINPFYGTTRNPVDRSRIAGGSSGGSAAAVAARLAAAATGSDTGGSVRIPAALCGCVGFKPTFGRLPTGGLLGACPTFDHVGLLARSADDVAIVFAALTGAASPAPAANRAVRTIRIGVARSFFFDDVQADVASAIDAAVRRAGASGARVIDRDLPIDGGTMARVFDPIVTDEIWRRYGEDWRRRPEAFSPGFGAFFATPPPSADAVRAARLALARFQADVDAAFAGVDVIATPAVPVTAPAIDGPIDAGLILRNTWPFNAARVPALTLPCGTDRLGLPVGLQLAARRGADEELLAVAVIVQQSVGG